MDTMSETKTGPAKIIDKNDEERTIHYGEPIVVDGCKYISLTKGEKCNNEAYSAFNYHITYDSSNPASPQKRDIPPNSAANSTGLWEWILMTATAETKKQITVTVCGLVGNVCVMHTLLQGIALWNNVYSKIPRNTDFEVKFVYSLMGTRFAAPPFVKIMPDFVSDEVVGHFNKNLPEGMQTISLSEQPISEHASGKITSFEVLDYDGSLLTTGIFEFIDIPSSDGGMRRRGSVRRRKNKSQKRQKGRRTHKNKRRYTKRR
jgi:hypothetical protein